MARLPSGIRRTELVELLDINDQLKVLEERKAEIVDKAKRAHAALPPDTYPYGPAILLLKEVRKFDPAAFQLKHPAEKHPEYYAQTVASTAVPKELRAKFVTVSRSLELKRAATVKPAT